MRVISGLSEQVRRFIAKYIVSVEQIEILVLLSDGPDRVWSVEDVFRVVKSSRGSIARRLKIMAEQGMLHSDNNDPAGYQFQPANEEMRQSIEALKSEYGMRPVQVIEAVFGPPDQVQIFASAFKFKRQDKK